MDFDIPLNISLQESVVVEKTHSAREIRSGNVDVFATPMMIALMETAALKAVQSYLPEGWTTVGTRVECDHLRATPVGDEVSAIATLIKREGRILYFLVEAWDSQGIIGKAHHQRFIINVEKFMKKLKKS